VVLSGFAPGSTELPRLISGGNDWREKRRGSEGEELGRAGVRWTIMMFGLSEHDILSDNQPTMPISDV